MSTYHSQKYAEQLEGDCEHQIATIKQISRELRLIYAFLVRDRPNVDQALAHLIKAYPGSEKELDNYANAREYNPARQRGGYDKVR